MRFYEYESRRLVERAGIPVTQYVDAEIPLALEAADLVALGMSREEFTELGGQTFGFKDTKRPPPPAGTAYHAEGCASCLGTGYTGRIGIYELLMMTDMVRAMVVKDTDANVIKKRAVEEEGMRTLRIDGTRKVIAGMTTIEEVMRVTQEDAL